MVKDIFCNADGNRLKLNWNQGRLNCDNWNWDGDGDPNLAVAALMVQGLFQRPHHGGVFTI